MSDFKGVALPRKFCGLDLGISPLVLLNFLLFGLHTILGAITLGVGDLEAKAPVYRSVAGTGSDSDRLVATGIVQVGALNLTALTATFFFITAFFHLGNALLWRKWYLAGVQSCFTPSRWVEYTFSAAVLIVLVGYSSGVVIAESLVAIFTLTAVTMFFGLLTEVVARPRSANEWHTSLQLRLQPHILGYVPQVLVWFIVLTSFYVSVSDVEATSSSVPSFVYAIVWGELILFWSFAAVQFAVTVLPPRFYPSGEIAYQLLSLTSKTFLGVIFLAYVLT